MERLSAADVQQAVDGFGVSVDLSRVFSDERSRCYMWVERLRPVRWLTSRLAARLALPSPARLALLSPNGLLHPDDPLALLAPGDTLRVVPVDYKVFRDTGAVSCNIGHKEVNNLSSDERYKETNGLSSDTKEEANGLLSANFHKEANRPSSHNYHKEANRMLQINIEANELLSDINRSDINKEAHGLSSDNNYNRKKGLTSANFHKEGKELSSHTYHKEANVLSNDNCYMETNELANDSRFGEENKPLNDNDEEADELLDPAPRCWKDPTSLLEGVTEDEASLQANPTPECLEPEAQAVLQAMKQRALNLLEQCTGESPPAPARRRRRVRRRRRPAAVDDSTDEVDAPPPTKILQLSARAPPAGTAGGESGAEEGRALPAGTGGAVVRRAVPPHGPRLVRAL